MAETSLAQTATLTVGDEAPDFTLNSATTEGSITLSSYRGSKNVVLAFFPWAFSGTCSAQMPSYEADLERFRSYDTEVLGISMDGRHSLALWVKEIGGSLSLFSVVYADCEGLDSFG